MTTLPQTINSRTSTGTGPGVGETNGHGPTNGTNGYSAGYSTGQLAPVSTMPALSTPVPATTGGAGGGAQLSGADIVRVLRENLWLILLAFVLSAAAGVGLNEYLQRHYLQYRADGKLLLKNPEILSIEGTGLMTTQQAEEELEVRLQTQRAGLKSEQLIQDILQESSNVVRDSSWLRELAGNPDGSLNYAKAKEALLANYNTGVTPGSQLIDVSLTTNNAEEAQQILHYIVQERLNDMRQQNRVLAEVELREIGNVVTTREQEIRNLNQQIENLRSAQTGDGTEIAGSIAALTGLIGQLSSQVIELNNAKLQIEEQLAAARDAIDRGVDPMAVNLIVNEDPTVLQARNLLQNIDLLVETEAGRLGENHPRMIDLRRQQDTYARRLRDTEANAKATARQQVISQYELQLAAIETQLKDAEEKREQFDERLVQLSNDAKDLASLYAQRDAKLAELEANKTAYSVKSRQIAQVPQEELIWFEPPSKPTSPSFPKLPLTVAACVLIGVGLAVGVAFLREILDTSVKSPRDVTRAGQMDVLGVIPDEGDDPEAAVGKNKLELTIANAPHSMTAEQFRTVRSRLAHVAPLESTRSILVTSPQPGDGKTTVACNLAAGMALNGRRVLLVDANFRKPAIHSVFEVPNDKGLAACLADAEQFDDSLVEVSTVPNLFVLPSGPRPANTTELIEGANFTDVLDRALEQFDLVIFDSGPVLFVSETGALAPQVDGVISVIRARRSSRGLLGRLRDSLRSMNVEHLGVVLNAVRSRAGGYYNRNMKTYYSYQNK